MLNNFIYAQTKDLFLEQLNAGNILDEAIVFIEDTKEIWNRGTYFAGSGDITASGINSIMVNGVSKTPADGVVDLGYINKKLITFESNSIMLSPNIYYRNTNTSLTRLSIILTPPDDNNILNEYFVEFTTSGGTTIELPSTTKWANGETPTFEENTTYQISIINNLGTVQKFK